MTELAHSPLGGSTLKRWSNCPGSIQLSKDIPNRKSSYADLGTRAHEVAAYRLTHVAYPPGVDVVTREAVQVYVDAVLGDLNAIGKRNGEMWVEKKVALTSIHPLLFGTADALIYDRKNKILKVFDYKHGEGTLVEVEEDGKPNDQLMYYALGAVISMNFIVEEVELVIVQPRCYHEDGPVRRKKVSSMELLEFAADLEQFAKATEDPGAKLKAGSHCKFCPAQPTCPEILKNALAKAKEEFSPAFSYNPKALADILHWLPTFSSWINSVREFAYGEAQHGRVPPGWKLVQKRATRKWHNEDSVSNFLCGKLNLEVEEIYDRVLRSPAQIEKVMKHLEMDTKLIGPYVLSESSGYTLAPETDKRTPVKLDAKNEFEVVSEIETQ